MRTKRLLLSFAFAGVMASGLLPGGSHDAFAQFYCGAGDTICIGSWCEPVTTPAARAICPLRRGGGGRRPSTGTRPRTGGRTAPTTTKFPSTTAHQIKPLQCPPAAPFPMAETAYGGLKCGTAAQVKKLREVFQNPPIVGQGGAPAAQPKQMQPQIPPQQAQAAAQQVTNMLQRVVKDANSGNDADLGKDAKDLTDWAKGLQKQKPGTQPPSR